MKFPFTTTVFSAFLLSIAHQTSQVNACVTCHEYEPEYDPDFPERTRRALKEEEVYDEILRCSSELYRVYLVSRPGENTPHFDLEVKPVAPSPTAGNANNNLICLDLGFSGVNRSGKKHIYDATMMIDSDDGEGSVDAELQSFLLGTADLGTIFTAYEAANPISNENYHIVTNNCVHFAASIWRMIGLPESNGLHDFLVKNILADTDKLNSFLRNHVLFENEQKNDHPAVTDWQIESFVDDAVASQLFIVVDSS